MTKEQYYDEGYHKPTHKNLLKNFEYYKARAHLSKVKYFGGVEDDNRILEYGIGMGQNIFLFPNAYGHDISKFAMDECNKRGVKTMPDLTGCDGLFDVVFSRAVLEHLDNPLEALKIMNKCLRPGGKLILVLGIEKQKRVKIEPSQNQHLYGWNFQTINNLLFKAGFHPQENTFLRGTGYNKLLALNKKSPKLYHLATYLAALAVGSKEMKIVAIKEEIA